MTPKFNLFDNDNKIFHTRLLPPSKFKKTMIDRSLISEGCILNAKEISNSVIGIRSRSRRRKQSFKIAMLWVMILSKYR
jgi:ADP-glucose pyrophosphorylase